MTGDAPLLAMRGITKQFGPNPVLRGVDLTLRGGEVLALLGENGAGKSTLMKILSGDYARDGGEVLLRGVATRFASPREAEQAGVRVIYQELNYAPDLSVTENVLMGHLPRRRGRWGAGLIDWAEAHRQTAKILATLAAEIDPRTLVGSLSVGQQQIVEIAKALSGDAHVLVMDEPTAALATREVERLFQTIASLRARGVGIIYISHRLDEIEQIADRVMVLRDGGVAGDTAITDTTRREIVQMMVGREVEQLYPAPTGQAGPTVLSVAGLTGTAFRDISFTVAAGEVVGLYGLLGAGQSEVARALFGDYPLTGGEIQVQGRPVSPRSPRHARAGGIGFVPEDRKRDGLVLGLGVDENLLLGNGAVVARGGILRGAQQRERADHWMEHLGIRAGGGAAQAVGTLSGGNQQKVVIARWLEAGTPVLVLCEPTRGVDVGARADIYAVINRLREQGLALILVSSDGEELMGLSDTIHVFGRGRIVGAFPRRQASQQTLLACASGEAVGATTV